MSSNSAADQNAITTGNDNGVEGYDPTAPVPWWHVHMEIATICIANGLTLIVIIARTWYRYRKLRRFRQDDRWLIAAGILLVFPYTVCQIGTVRYGSGMHVQNVPDAWLKPHWIFSWGWFGYYLISSMIKISVCCCLIEILPYTFQTLRRWVYGLCVFTMMLGIMESCIWVFQCRPFLSNFVYEIDNEWCIPLDPVRYLWVGLSIPIDLAVIAIPFEILRQTNLKKHERRVLLMVFGANLLGTIACAVGLYGVWANRSDVDNDLPYTETIFVMTNDIELTLYTLGASFPVLSRYFVSRAAPGASEMNPSVFSSWYRRARSPFNTILSRSKGKTAKSGQLKVDSGDIEAPMTNKAISRQNRTFMDGKYDEFRFFGDSDHKSTGGELTIDSLGSVLDGEGRYIAEYEKYGIAKGGISGETGSSKSDKVIQKERERSRSRNRSRENSWGRTMWLESVNASRSRESQEPMATEGKYDRGVLTSAIPR